MCQFDVFDLNINENYSIQTYYCFRVTRLTKVESYESRDTLKANSLRSSFSKSYSFGGYDQNAQHAQNARALSKQGNY